MAIKTFTSGEVLTASDTNTYLANSGLVYVKSQAVIGSPTTITVTNAFSADYDDYRIIYSGGTQNINGSSWLQLGPTSVSGYNTNYNMVLIYAGGSATVASNINSTWFSWVGGGTGNQQSHLSCDLFGPFKTAYTKMRNGSYQDGTLFGTCHGEHTLATSYSSLTIGGMTFTGGTVYVYGYRKP